MSEYFFRRYCNGTRMAEGVQITKAVTLEDACIAASRIAAQYKDGTTLVYVPTDVLWAHKQLAQDRALIDALRAELAAEREQSTKHANALYDAMHRNNALRALLREAGDLIRCLDPRDAFKLRARIDRALKGDGDE